MQWVIIALLALVACAKKPKPEAQVFEAEPFVEEVAKPIAHRGGALPASSPRVNLGPIIQFDLNSASLKHDIDTDFLIGAKVVTVVGHACPLGTDEYNDALSMHRAFNVTQSLIRGGVPKDIIKTEWRGEREPLPGDYSLSRRVEITFKYRAE